MAPELVENVLIRDTNPMDSDPPVPLPTSQGEVEVHLFAAARSAAGAPCLTVPAGALPEVLGHLVRQAPRLAEVLPRCSFLRDGLALTSDDAVLVPGQRLDVLPPFAGG